MTIPFDEVDLEGENFWRENPVTEDEEQGSVIDEIIRGAGIDPDVTFSGKTPEEIQGIMDQYGEQETGGITRATVQDALEVTNQENETPSKKPKSKRVAYSVACTLHISGSDYQVQLLPEDSKYDKGYRLNKVNAQKPTGYNITQIDGEIICQCHDFIFRRDEKGCKHIKGLVDMGMFSAPSAAERMRSGVFDG